MKEVTSLRPDWRARASATASRTMPQLQMCCCSSACSTSRPAAAVQSTLRFPCSSRSAVFMSSRRVRIARLRAGSREDAGRGAAEGGKAQDPFLQAGVRLQNLLNGVGDGEEEFLNSMLRDEHPLQKLSINALLAVLITFTAFTICWLLGADPWGGASLSLHSAQSAAVGAALAAPLALLRGWSWSRGAARTLPALDNMHRGMMEESRPWLLGLDTPHLAALVALDVLPLMFLLLPAAQGGLGASFGWYNAVLEQLAGARLPEHMGPIAALLVTATVVGLSKWMELNVGSKEYEIVRSSVENADRYYKLTVSSQGEDAGAHSTAFKAVALSWITSKQDAGALAGAVSFLDVLTLGAIWYGTGDLAAAAVAALVAQGVDYHFMHAALQRKQQHGGKQQRGGPPLGSS